MRIRAPFFDYPAMPCGSLYAHESRFDPLLALKMRMNRGRTFRSRTDKT